MTPAQPPSPRLRQDQRVALALAKDHYGFEPGGHRVSGAIVVKTKTPATSSGDMEPRSFCNSVSPAISHAAFAAIRASCVMTTAEPCQPLLRRSASRA